MGHWDAAGAATPTGVGNGLSPGATASRRLLTSHRTAPYFGCFRSRFFFPIYCSFLALLGGFGGDELS